MQRVFCSHERNKSSSFCQNWARSFSVLQLSCLLSGLPTKTKNSAKVLCTPGNKRFVCDRYMWFGQKASSKNSWSFQLLNTSEGPETHAHNTLSAAGWPCCSGLHNRLELLNLQRQSVPTALFTPGPFGHLVVKMLLGLMFSAKVCWEKYWLNLSTTLTKRVLANMGRINTKVFA